MLIVMQSEIDERELNTILKKLQQLHPEVKPEVLPGATRIAIGIMGNKDYVDENDVIRFPGVKEIIHVTKPYKRVSREFKVDSTTVEVNKVPIGQNHAPVIIAGPCSVESASQIEQTASFLKNQGVRLLRGGLFKPRTSPYAFQGLGTAGWDFFRIAQQDFGMGLVSELTSIQQLDFFVKHIDCIQIGARNMQNFDLLKELGKLDKPILLKRGMAAKLEEFLLAAEYLLSGGNPHVMLCERGVRTFETSSRNILDLNSLSLIKELSHLPVIADPSHAAGQYRLVRPLARAAIAAGADAILVEVHPDPSQARSDAKQQLSFAEFEKLHQNLLPLMEMRFNAQL